MSGDICSLVLHLLTGELDQRVVHRVSRHDINYLRILLICPNAFLPLLRVEEKVTDLKSRTLLSSTSLRILSCSADHLAVLEDGSIGKVLPFCFAYHS